jgi:voltage-gated potassium channel
MTETKNTGEQQTKMAWFSKRGFWRFSTVKLLLALILLFAATPFIEDLPNGELVESGLMTLVLIASLRVVGGNPRILLTGALLVVPAIAGKWLNHVFPTNVPIHYFLVFGMAFMAFATAIILRFILRTSRVDAEVLCAGIVVYLMLGLLWSLGYTLLAQTTPGSFSFAGAGNSASRMDGFNAFYFSFGTLTTVGFGDITPVSKVARTLAIFEAVMGTFYLAILISRLVGMYSPSTGADRGQNSDRS